MTRHLPRRAAACAVSLLLTVPALADTLILRNGRRVQGELISVRSGVIEFEEDRGWSTRTLRIDRDDVRAIELTADGSTGDEDAEETRPGGRPRGLRERDVTVPANVAWTDTGVDAREGQRVFFGASGRVNWAPGSRDGPAGAKNAAYDPRRPMPMRPAGGLIGKIGRDSTDYFFIGDVEEAFRMPDSGRLYLGVNDDGVADNSGSFRVTVYF